MLYDVDAATLSTFKVEDSQLSVAADDAGRIVASIELTRRIVSLEQLNRTFFRFWGQVCFAWSEVKRELGDDSISYVFRTGNDRLDYHGVVTFRGEPIQRLLRRLRKLTI